MTDLSALANLTQSSAVVKAEEEPQQAKPQKVVRYYKAVIPSINFIFPNGKPAIFVRGRYKTDVPGEIEYLDREIDAGHPHIKHMEEADLRVVNASPEELVQQFKDAVISEFLASQRDFGNSAAGPVKAASSSDVAVAAAGGSGQPVLSPLMSELANRLRTQGVTITPTPAQNPGVPKLTDLLPQLGTQIQENGPTVNVAGLMG